MFEFVKYIMAMHWARDQVEHTAKPKRNHMLVALTNLPTAQASCVRTTSSTDSTRTPNIDALKHIQQTRIDVLKHIQQT